MSQVKNSLDKESLIKILKGAGIAGGAVILLYIMEALLSMDFGQMTPIIVGILSVLINAIREYQKGQ